MAREDNMKTPKEKQWGSAYEKHITELEAEVERLKTIEALLVVRGSIIDKQCAALRVELADYHRLQRGCPSCIKGKPERVMIDNDGVLCSVSSKPGRWGHCWDDYHWFCADAGAVAENDALRKELMHWRGVAFAIEALRALNRIHDRRRWVVTSGPGDNPTVEKMYISKPVYSPAEKDNGIDNA